MFVDVLKMPELKAALGKCGRRKTGNKPQLAARLKEYIVEERNKQQRVTGTARAIVLDVMLDADLLYIVLADNRLRDVIHISEVSKEIRATLRHSRPRVTTELIHTDDAHNKSTISTIHRLREMWSITSMVRHELC